MSRYDRIWTAILIGSGLGLFPLWNTEAVLGNIERAIEKANAQGIPVIIIQHIAKQGLAPFFNEGTPGAESEASS